MDKLEQKKKVSQVALEAPAKKICKRKVCFNIQNGP
jgi:hypothetical protein